MESELTGRKVKITKELRQISEDGLARIEKIVGAGASAHVIFSSQKHGEIAEVTVAGRHHTIVGAAEAPGLVAALRMALEKAEKQALRHRKSFVENKRHGKPIRAVLPAEEAAPASRRSKKAAAGKGKNSGLHIVPAPEAMASRPMTLEEAVKEAESRDQQVFVFRDPEDGTKVLHCAGDGIVRLIEVT